MEVPTVAPRTFGWATAAPAPLKQDAPPPSQDGAAALSNQALADMRDAYQRSPDRAMDIGLGYARQIATSVGNDAERATAQTAMDCVAYLQQLPPDVVSNAVAGVVALVGCFHAIAAATGGPVGQMLASAGLDALTNPVDITAPQADIIGLYSVHALETTPGTEPAQQVVAGLSRQVYSALDGNPTTCAKVLRSALFVCSKPMTGTVGASLARTGLSAMYDRDIPVSDQDADVIGLGYTHGIQDHGTPEESAAAGQTLSRYETTREAGASAAQCANLLGDFLEGVAGSGWVRCKQPATNG